MGNGSFEKPSDYKEGAGGGDGYGIWVWLGGGCAVLLALGAVLLVFGAYKGFSCCRETLEQQAEARLFALEYARLLRDAEYDEAWKQSAESFQDRTSRESFERRIEQYRSRIRKSTPVPMGMNREIQSANGPGYWVVDIGFMPNGGETFVVMNARLAQRGEGDERRFRVDKLKFRERRRDLASEPPVRRIQTFNRQLSEDELEAARGALADEFEQGRTEGEFEQFFDGHDDVLGRTLVRVETVRYNADGPVTVEALHDRRGGSTDRVRYRLVRAGGPWKIDRIEFGVEAPNGDGPDTADSAQPETGAGASESEGQNLDAE